MKGPIDIKGAVALIITLTFGIVLVSVVIGALVTGRTVGTEAVHLLSTICGALIGVLATYIGDKVSGEEKK
jgi:Co/Zn/Cd efflux system component